MGIKEASVDTNLLYIMISKMKPGDILTYLAMEIELSRPWSALRGSFQTARRRAQREDRIVLRNIRGVGYQRIDDNQIAGGVFDLIPKLRRANRREIKRIQCIEGGELDEKGRANYNAGRTITSFIATMLKPKSILKIENAIKAKGGELPTGEVTKTLKLFKGDQSEA